jgi:protein-tyrosine phosphatase
MIQDFFKQPSVILIHCMQGVDRTGEITGAYEMKRFGKSVKEIIYQDTVINNGHPAPKIRNLNALLWYDMCINYGGC